MECGMHLQLVTTQAEQCEKQHKLDDEVVDEQLQHKYGHIQIEHLRKVHDSLQNRQDNSHKYTIESTRRLVIYLHDSSDETEQIIEFQIEQT